MTTDGDLCRQAQKGERSALSELARRWAARVLGVCQARVRRLDVAEDLAQEALLRALRSLSTLENPDAFGAWLRGIADRVALDWLKSPLRRQAPFSTLGNGAPDPPDRADDEQPLERFDESSRLQAEIERLPDECREAVMLFYFDSLTYDDIARRLAVSRATVNARLAKARDLLRRRLSSDQPPKRDATPVVASDRHGLHPAAREERP